MSNPKNDPLSPLQRMLEALVLPLLFLLILFLAAHQWLETGFYTEAFGPFEMLCLYGPLAIAPIAPAIRVITGRRHPSLPFEAATSIVLALGSMWLLRVFPFDFTYLADLLPGMLQFTMGWLTAGLARFILIVQVVLGPITAISTMWKFFTHRPAPQRLPL